MGNHKIAKLMLHLSLATPLEILKEKKIASYNGSLPCLFKNQ